jgi:hypothetical protein
MTPNVNDWFRSLGVLGTAFAAVVVFTLGTAAAIVPTGVSPPRAGGATPDASAPAAGPTAAARPTAVGGTLLVTGDREGSFVLDRETTQDRYGLVGPEGRILFDGPEALARIQYDGLEFFLEPDDCTVEPGARHDPTGVAGAHVRCDDIEDVRDGGTISVEGTVGVAADLFGLRGDLPETGGSLELGDETLTFEGARFTVAPFAGAFIGQLVDERIDPPAAIAFGYDPQTHAITVTEVQFAGDTVTPRGCTVGEERIGLLNPHTRVVELSIRCDALDVPALGTVRLDGTIVADLAEPPR